MYLGQIAPAAYSPPWDIPFDRRIAMLRRGTPRAAYFYAMPDTSTFRYRAYNVAQTLAALPCRSGASAAWFTAADFDVMPRVLDACDVLVLCRNSLYNDAVARIAAMARARGRPVLFDVDDLVFDRRYTHLLMDTLKQDTRDEAVLNYWFAYTARVAATFDLCDGAIVTNDHLAAQAMNWSGKPARVIPNYLNREQLDVSSRIWEAKEATHWRRDGLVHIGYFSGSPSHDRDFELVAPAIADLMDREPLVRLRVVGFLNTGNELNRHSHRIDTIPLQDFLNLQREKGATELNIVPLQENTFTHCKSDLKWFEAAVVGALTIASPTHAYQRVIEHGRNGWLAHAGAWRDLLSEVVQDLPALRADIAPRAREEALDRYGPDHQAARISAALFESW